MKKITLLVAVLMMVAFAGTGCKKQQPPPPPMPPQGAPGQAGMPGAPHGDTGAPPVEKKVVVPNDVKAGWKAVKVEVEYKEKKNKKATFTIPLNSEFKVPDTDLTLKVGIFLPHFAMAADQITSSSNNPENPALQFEVFQGGKEIFHGWSFSKYPAVHPFTHDKYGLALIEGVKK